MAVYRAKTNASKTTGQRRETIDGVEYLVVPAVMIVQGVLNGALLLAEEFGRYVESWDGRPVPVAHPVDDNGEPLSANAPTQEGSRNIGRIYNTRLDGDKLKTEVWIDIAKAKRMGFTRTLAAIERGDVMEVSTGYFSDSEVAEGEYNGVPYTEIHRNIRPDHLALLPGDIGACSVDDGCGLRSNRRSVTMKINTALATIAKALGIKTNSKEVPEMDDKEFLALAEKLHTNNKLTAKQLENLQEMSPAERKLISALIKALDDMPEEVIEDPEEVIIEGDDEPELMKEKEGQLAANCKRAAAAKKDGMVSMAEVDKLVANKVKDAIRRAELTTRLIANAACPFDASELESLPIAHLEKLEKSIRPKNYAGAGGFASNSQEVDNEAQPMVLNRGLLTKTKEEGAK